MIFLLILGIILVIASICLGTALLKESIEKIYIMFSYLAFMLGWFFITDCIYSNPRAIDVYRRKTELRITYEGKTPVDTVVVFKKK